MTLIAEPRASGKTQNSAFVSQMHVLHALILHDIKNRFFGNGTGYIVTVLWPIVHIAVILVLNIGRLSPHGSSMVLYATTAVIPWIACNYVGRFIMLGVLTNKPFLQYPIVKPLDLMLARVILETVSNFFVVIVVLSGLALLGVDIMPVRIEQAAEAWAASIALGIGFGILGGVLTMVYPLFQIIFIFFIIGAWITCGIGIDPEALPENYGYYLSFNPVLHAVEWMRQAYYPDFTARLLSKSYLICYALVCAGIGLVSERVWRGFLIQSR